jgi:very-short-patch-repair endonuclease
VDFVPGSDADELEWLLFEQKGVLTTAQVTDHCGRPALRRQLRRRQWRRICAGVVSTHTGPLTRDQQLWVAVLVAGPGARLAGTTAASQGGVRGLRPGPVQVLIPASRNRSALLSHMPDDMAPVRVRRTIVLPPSHQQAASPPRTTTARAVVDAAGWAENDDEARTIIAAACQQRRVQPAELRAVLNLLPGIRRHRLIAATINDVAGGAESLAEIDFMNLCRRHRLPCPSRQQRRTDAEGRRRFLDAYWAEQRLHVEVDGSHHMDVRHWAADMLRQNLIWIGGDRILRFPAWLLRADPAVVVAQLRAALTTDTNRRH